MIYTGNLQSEEFKLVMTKEFEMTDVGLMKYFLGVEIVQFSQGICISQHKYATNIVKIMNKWKIAEHPYSHAQN